MGSIPYNFCIILLSWTLSDHVHCDVTLNVIRMRYVRVYTLCTRELKNLKKRTHSYWDPKIKRCQRLSRDVFKKFTKVWGYAKTSSKGFNRQVQIILKIGCGVRKYFKLRWKLTDPIWTMLNTSKRLIVSWLNNFLRILPQTNEPRRSFIIRIYITFVDEASVSNDIRIRNPAVFRLLR